MSGRGEIIKELRAVKIQKFHTFTGSKIYAWLSYVRVKRERKMKG
jgi:hypothetical protein